MAENALLETHKDKTQKHQIYTKENYTQYRSNNGGAPTNNATKEQKNKRMSDSEKKTQRKIIN